MFVDRKSLAAHKVASKHAGRYAIDSVLLREDGTTVATNGRVLLAVEPIKQEDFLTENSVPVKKEGMLMPARLVKDMFAASKKKGRPITKGAAVTECEGKDIEMTWTDGEVKKVATATCGIGMGTIFPKFGVIFAQSYGGKTQYRIGLGVDQLQTLLNAFKEIAPEENTTLEFCFDAPDKGTLIRFKTGEGERRAAAVLMPVHPAPGDSKNDLTDWERSLFGFPKETTTLPKKKAKKKKAKKKTSKKKATKSKGK